MTSETGLTTAGWSRNLAKEEVHSASLCFGVSQQPAKGTSLCLGACPAQTKPAARAQ